jgi:thiamine-monophosphate kinase
MVRRGTGQIGDRIYVTGTLGDAALGLILQRDPHAFEKELTRGDRGFLVARYLRPSPRLALAPLLRAHASAALDISDGLAKDLARLAAGVGGKAAVAFADLPLSPPARRMLVLEPSLNAAPISGGDDYEVLFAVPEKAVAAFEAGASALPFAVTRIGVIAEGHGVAIADAAGAPMPLGPMGYDHFT